MDVQAEIEREQTNWGEVFGRLLELRKEEERAWQRYYFLATRIGGHDNANLRCLLADMKWRQNGT